MKMRKKGVAKRKMRMNMGKTKQKDRHKNVWNQVGTGRKFQTFRSNNATKWKK